MGQRGAIVMRRFGPERSRVRGTDFHPQPGRAVKEHPNRLDLLDDQFVAVTVFHADPPFPRFGQRGLCARLNQIAIRRLGVDAEELPEELPCVGSRTDPRDPHADPPLAVLGTAGRLNVAAPPAIETAADHVGVVGRVVNESPGQDDAVEEQIEITTLFKRDEIDPFSKSRRSIASRSQEEELALLIDTPRRITAPRGEVLDDRAD